MSDYKVTDTQLTSVANAIRAKTGKSAQIEFPTEFVSEIGSISGGGGRTLLGYGDVNFQNTTTDSGIGDQETGHITTKLLTNDTEQTIYTNNAIDLTDATVVLFVFDALKINSSTSNAVCVGINENVQIGFSNSVNNSPIKQRFANTSTISSIIPLDVRNITGSYYLFYASKLTFSNNGDISSNFTIWVL